MAAVFLEQGICPRSFVDLQSPMKALVRDKTKGIVRIMFLIHIKINLLLHLVNLMGI